MQQTWKKLCYYAPGQFDDVQSKPCWAMKTIWISQAMNLIGQEPISCFCSIRQLDVQVHLLAMTLVCRRELAPIQPLMLSFKQGGTGSHLLESLVWRDPGLNPGLLVSGQTLKPLGYWAGTWYHCNPWKSQHRCRHDSLYYNACFRIYDAKYII